MNLTHLILFDFFQGAGGLTTTAAPSGPWFVAAFDSYSAGAAAADTFP